jgi:hypothetical protein
VRGDEAGVLEALGVLGGLGVEGALLDHLELLAELGDEALALDVQRVGRRHLRVAALLDHRHLRPVLGDEPLVLLALLLRRRLRRVGAALDRLELRLVDGAAVAVLGAVAVLLARHLRDPRLEHLDRRARLRLRRLGQHPLLARLGLRRGGRRLGVLQLPLEPLLAARRLLALDGDALVRLLLGGDAVGRLVGDDPLEERVEELQRAQPPQREARDHPQQHRRVLVREDEQRARVLALGRRQLEVGAQRVRGEEVQQQLQDPGDQPELPHRDVPAAHLRNVRPHRRRVLVQRADAERTLRRRLDHRAGLGNFGLYHRARLVASGDGALEHPVALC